MGSGGKYADDYVREAKRLDKLKDVVRAELTPMNQDLKITYRSGKTEIIKRPDTAKPTGLFSRTECPVQSARESFVKEIKRKSGRSSMFY